MGPTRLPGYLGTPGVSGGGESRGMKLLILSRCLSRVPFPLRVFVEMIAGAQKGDWVLFLPRKNATGRNEDDSVVLLYFVRCRIGFPSSSSRGQKCYFFLGKIKQEKITPVHSAKTHSGIIAHSKSTCTTKSTSKHREIQTKLFF